MKVSMLFTTDLLGLLQTWLPDLYAYISIEYYTLASNIDTFSPPDHFNLNVFSFHRNTSPFLPNSLSNPSSFTEVSLKITLGIFIV